MALAPKKNTLNLLRKLVPLNTLDDEALQEIMENSPFEKLKKGDHLFNRGDRDGNNVYLLSGRVGLLTGKREVDVVSAGSDTARFPLAHHTPRKNTVVAKILSEIVRIDSKLLSNLLAEANGGGYDSDETGPESDDWMSQLIQSQAFQHIPPSNIQGVMMCMEELPVEEGELIVNQGDEGDYFYLVNRGHCRVTRVNSDGEEPIELAQLGPGDSFGEEALLSDTPRGSSITMLSDGMLVRLTKELFVKYIKHSLARLVDFKQADGLIKKGALWLDVRTPDEYAEHSLPGAINIPLASLRYQLSSIDPIQSYVVYCDDGHQSATAAYLLISQGIKSVVLNGGLVAIPGAGNAGQSAVKKQVPTPSKNQAEVIDLHPEPTQQESDRLEVSPKRPGPSSPLSRDDARLQKLSREIECLKKSLQQSNVTASKERKAREAAEEVQANLSFELDDVNESLSQHISRLERMQKTEDALTVERNSARAELTEAKKESEQLRSELEQISSSGESQQKVVEDARRRLEVELLTAQREVGRVTEELKQIQKQAEQRHKKEKDRVEGLEQELDGARLQRAEAQQALGGLEVERDRALDRADKSGQSKKALKQQLTELQQSMDQGTAALESEQQAVKAQLQQARE
ncbi:MAG: cyclic nucleotide-binding domain-containing protein, partial [Gammaproteobacteria bacterium]|nr:cyclic nucleotide-binding domain-containing protein [Gammaproteobacteria bacterium]